MEFKVLSHISLVLLLNGVYGDINDEKGNPETSSDPPRINRRVVKLYSGARVRPIICEEEGFMGDPNDCSIFHRCVRSGHGRYISFRFQCGPGTFFDPDAEICNHPEKITRTSCSRKLTPSTEKNTYENYVNREVPSPISTFEPNRLQIFHSTQRPWNLISSSTYASENYVVSNANKKQRFTGSSIASNEYINKLQQTTTSAIYFTSQQLTNEGEICRLDGFMGDTRNCRKFYRCVGNNRGSFIRYEFMCSDPTIWDDEKQGCNHAQFVKKTRCGQEKMYSEKIDVQESQTRDREVDNPTKSDIIQSQSQITYGSKVTQTQTQSSSGAVKQNQTQINYENGSNVKQNQTQISYGSAVSQTQNQINFGDKGIQTQLQINHSKDSSQMQSQQLNLNDRQDKTTEAIPQTSFSTSKNEGTSNDCTESGFIGDSKDCKKFYRCVDNGRGGYTKYEFTCGDGTVWDSKLESCNHVWAVKDCKRKGPPGTSSNAETTQSTTKSTTKSTQGYYTSEETPSEESEEPSYGMNPASLTTTTTTTASITTTEKKPSQTSEGNRCKSSGFMGDSDDCKKFYRCVDNGNGQYTRYDFTCGQGTVWDSKIDACNHAWAVKNCGERVETTTLTSNNLSSESNDYDVGYGNSEDEATPTSSISTTITTTTKTSSTSTENTASDKEKVCNSSGFIGDKNNCKKFYRCVDNGNGSYTKYEFSCGDGTVWDSETQSCNHAWAVKNCGENSDILNTETSTYTSSPSTKEPSNETNSPQTNTPPTSISSTPVVVQESLNDNICTSSGFIGDRNDCKKFYRCVDNGSGGYTRYDFSCGEGTFWDSKIESCNHAWAVECSGNEKPNEQQASTENPASPIYDDINNDGYPPQHDEYTETASSVQTTQLPFNSSNSCQTSGFMADNKDCKKFYRCVEDEKGGYTQYDFTCGEGTVWDPSIEACNHQWAVHSCNISHDDTNSNNVQSTTQFSSSSESNEQEHMQHSTTESFTSSSKPSSQQCTQEGFYGDDNDCKLFYRCVGDGKGGFTKYDFTCGDGTVWVQEIQACDHDNDMNNCTSSSKPSSTTDSSSIATQAQSTNTENSNSAAQTTSPPNISSTSSTSSSSKCTSEGFYGDESDCTKFYRCVDDGQGSYTKYEFKCGDGTAWDTNIQTCNHIEEVKNCSQSEHQESVSDSIMQDEQVSSTTESTSTTKESNSNESGDTSDKCQQEGYFGNSKDCTKFYRCVDDGKGGFTKYDFDCAEGTIWDQDVITCNHPQDVKNPSCDNKTENEEASQTESSLTSSTSSTTSTSSTQTTQSNENNNSHNNSCSGENSNQKPSNQNVKCEKEGYYANPDDCKKFYRCVDWDGNGEKFSVYHFECGEGTIWDPQLDTCNHEDSVYPPRDCSGTQSQSEATTSSSSSTTTTTTTTTEKQESTTEKQETTTEKQETTTEKQETTTEKQETTTEKEEKTTTKQETTTEKEETTTTKQEITTEKQDNTTEKQESTTEKNETTTDKQDSSTTETSSSLTSENTTTQETSSSEHTTESQSNNEQTTSGQPTTTEQSTSNEDTTTQKASEENTTQESNEQTTTQKTNEETTTQKSDEETTTQKESSTEQSTESTTSSSTDSGTSDADNTTTTTVKEDTSTTESSATSEQTSNKDCPETDDDQYLYVCPTSFRRHPKYCNMFYQCTEDDDTHELKIATFTCPNNTIYDENQTQCVEENKADKKCEGQRARKLRVKRLQLYSDEPIEVDRQKRSCKASGYYSFDSVNECSPIFLKCQLGRGGKIKGFVHQCPEGYVYWSISKRCERKETMKYCKQSRNSNWKNRWQIPIERKNVAK